MTTDDLLQALLKDIADFACVPDDQIIAPRPEPYVVGMVLTGVPYRPEKWFPLPMTPAARMAYSRAARRLEQEGLVHRVTEQGRDRVTHLILTAKGLAHGLTLAGTKVDRGAVMEGLQRTHWGEKLLTSGGDDHGADDQEDLTLAPIEMPLD